MEIGIFTGAHVMDKVVHSIKGTVTKNIRGIVLVQYDHDFLVRYKRNEIKHLTSLKDE